MSYKKHYYFSVLILALLLAERLLIPIETFNLITSIVGLFMLYLLMRRKNVERRINILSVVLPWKEPKRTILYAMVVPVLSILLVLALEQMVFRLTGHSGFFLVPTKHLYFANIHTSVLWSGVGSFLRWSAVGMGFCLVRTLFLELSFRGYMFYNVAVMSNPGTGNIPHSLLFSAVMATPPVYALWRSFRAGEMTSGKEWVYIVAIVSIVVYFFLLGIRQGELRLLSESVLPCVLSYWIFDFASSMVNAPSFWPAYLVPFASVFRMLAIQIAACLLSIPMFIQNKNSRYSRRLIPDERAVDVEKIANDILRRESQTEL